MPSPVAGGNPWAALGQVDYYNGLMAKLPPGEASDGPMWQNLMGAGGAGGIAQGFADVQAAASQLSEVETVPSTADVLLGYWEADYGLPDCCTPSGPSLQQRRNALMAKIAAFGGASIAYFHGVAAALGWAITITENPGGAANSWVINAASTAPSTIFTAGGSVAGDYLTTFGSNAELECVMNRIKPAHTVLTFSYT